MRMAAPMNPNSWQIIEKMKSVPPSGRYPYLATPPPGPAGSAPEAMASIDCNG